MPANPPDAFPRRVLIFDFDGVVVHTEHVHFESWKAALRDHFGADIEGTYDQVVGLTLDELMRMWVAAGEVPDSAMEPDVMEQLLALKTEHFFRIGEDSLRPIDGIAELVVKAQAQGWYTAIASRGRRLRLLRTLQLVRIPAVFELVLSAEDVVDITTDRKVHSRVSHMLGAAPLDCMVIEDSVGGIDDALNSGIGRVIGLTTSIDAAKLIQAGAHLVVDSLHDIVLERNL